MNIKLGEKEILLEEIRYYQGIVNQSIKLQHEHQNFYSKPPFILGLGLGGKIVTFLIIWFLIGNFANPTLGVLLFLAAIYFLFIWPTVHVKKKVKNNIERINEIKFLLKELSEKIDPIHIPKGYINIYALTKLESYILNKRADNLKEALNLFEQEKRHDQQMQEINTVQQLQEMTYKKANEATTLGWMNLFSRN